MTWLRAPFIRPLPVLLLFLSMNFMLSGCFSSDPGADPGSGSRADSVWLRDSTIMVSQGDTLAVYRLFYDGRNRVVLDSSLYTKDGRVFSSRSEYDAQGRLARKFERDDFSHSSSEYRYTADGDTAEISRLDKNSIAINRSVMEYDSRRRLSRQLNYMGTGLPLEQITLYRFGADTLVDTIIATDPEGGELNRSIFTYIEGNLTKVVWRVISGFETATLYALRPDGKIAEQTSTTSQGGVIYGYDDHGNTVRYAFYSADRTQIAYEYHYTWKRVPVPK